MYLYDKRHKSEERRQKTKDRRQKTGDLLSFSNIYLHFPLTRIKRLMQISHSVDDYQWVGSY